MPIFHYLKNSFEILALANSPPDLLTKLTFHSFFPLCFPKSPFMFQVSWAGQPLEQFLMIATLKCFINEVWSWWEDWSQSWPCWWSSRRWWWWRCSPWTAWWSYPWTSCATGSRLGLFREILDLSQFLQDPSNPVLWYCFEGNTWVHVKCVNNTWTTSICMIKHVKYDARPATYLSLRMSPPPWSVSPQP